MALSLMEGNEAIVRGAISAGCRFFAGYPITPATTIFNAMLKLLPPLGGICLQGEDEMDPASAFTASIFPLPLAVKFPSS